jgi:hypothetical protein
VITCAALALTGAVGAPPAEAHGMSDVAARRATNGFAVWFKTEIDTDARVHEVRGCRRFGGRHKHRATCTLWMYVVDRTRPYDHGQQSWQYTLCERNVYVRLASKRSRRVLYSKDSYFVGCYNDRRFVSPGSGP